MNVVVRVALQLFALSWVLGTARADVVFSEIMYRPIGGRSLEFFELHNDSEEIVDLSGWTVDGGVAFSFDDGAVIGADGHVVVARDREALIAAYPELDASRVHGNYQGSLSNGGEPLQLLDSAGEIVEDFTYDNRLPWDVFADGFGGSLERVCETADPSLPENWRTDALSPPGTPGGTPGAGSSSECPPGAPRATGPLYISEIMYHAVLENDFEDQHEFLELYNSSDTSIDLAGYRIFGGIEFEFPEDATVEADSYVVLAKNPQALAAVEKYGLSEDKLFGGYERTLDNGGERLALIDASGLGVDMVEYDDDFPWAIGADALGAGRSWLSGDVLPLEDHQYMGRSLERVSFSLHGSLVENWVASGLDEATPGLPNKGARETALPTVVALEAAGEDGSGELIRSTHEVFVFAQIRPAPTSPVSLEYFVDDIARSNEDIESTQMFDDGIGGGDFVPNDGIYTIKLPARAAQSIVRYRVVMDRGAGDEVVSPRASDPMDWHAYFVSPVINSETRTYQLFISPVNWGRLWTNMGNGRASGCNYSQTWNAKVPAVFVHEGRVFDVRVRYQGSRWNRRNGRTISRWNFPRPSTGQLLALSWRIGFPRYDQLGGLSVVTLNKLTQSCPGLNSTVGYRLFEEVDLPSSETRYIRFHINGGYYNYMIEYERPGEELIRRYNNEMADKYPELPREEVGHLHKSAGCNCDEGPYGWGDMRLLPPRCGFSSQERYSFTYNRKTHEWEDYSEFERMINALHVARRGGTQAMRDFFEEFFDVDLYLNYVAIINWSVPFDDMFQNHFLYQRRSDGKWFATPWDLDQNFGGWRGPDQPINCGEQGSSCNRSGWWNYLKDALLKSHRQEFEDRLLFLNNTLLHPDNIGRMVDEAIATANPQEASQAPAGFACNFPSAATSFKSFARTRFDVVNRLAGVETDAGPDQTVFVGETVQFDASETDPPPSDEVTYEWDNGLVGATPTFVYNEPGEYEVTLTVSLRGIPFSDSVIIRVLPLPERAYVEKDGLIVFEAENPFMIDSHGQEAVEWQVATETPGFSGDGYLLAAEIERRRTFLSRYSAVSPEARYPIKFETAGTYRVWVRAFVTDTRHDTVHVNLGSVERSGNFAAEFEIDESGFQWSGETRREGALTVEVTQPGLTYLSLWMRESAISIDKIVMTRDTDYVPERLGPDESPTEAVGGGDAAFVRGDVDASGAINITDAVAILSYLFRGLARVSCEDHADVDDSGTLDLTDAVALLNFLFRSGVAPAPPFPEAGFDETADAFPCGSA